MLYFVTIISIAGLIAIFCMEFFLWTERHKIKQNKEANDRQLKAGKARRKPSKRVLKRKVRK